ncbi:minor tail protein [Arthrobacter phage Molivia]|uniref:Minor tail protein n=1 Tax=Arthrobacter phage Molivia TaxID=2015839 RepID=A0A286N4D9_9CAUD|nr:tail protein [Arthrobacter phage Molivia]ASX99246.1 minor tail protein [Arthrobacter phage Molivia]
MAVLPSEIPTGLVTGQFYFVNEDNIDADTDPELIVVTGKVTFTCEAKDPLRMPTKKAVIIPMTFDAEFDSQGRIVPKGQTDVGIELPASNSPLFNPTNFTWKVEFDLKEVASGYSVVLPSFSIFVREGETWDIVDLMPVSMDPGTIMIQGPQGVAGDMAPIAASANKSGAVSLAESDMPSVQPWTLTGNVTLSLFTPVLTPARTGTISLVLRQDGTGNRTITWPASVKWPDGIAQQPAAAASSKSVIHLMWDGTDWLGVVGGKSFA